jgi:hypothetical protein
VPVGAGWGGDSAERDSCEEADRNEKIHLSDSWVIHHAEDSKPTAPFGVHGGGYCQCWTDDDCNYMFITYCKFRQMPRWAI